MSAEKHDATSSEDENELAPIKSPVSPAPKSLRSPRTSLLPVVNSNERTQTQTPPLIQGPPVNPSVTQSSTPTARTRALSSFSQSSDENSGLAPPSTGRKRISMSFTLPVAPSPDVPAGSPPLRPQHLDTYTGANHSPTPSGSGLRTLSASRTASTKSPPPQQPQAAQTPAEDRPERGRSRNTGSGGPGSEVMEYLSQLATKESRVSKLREKLLEVKRELESAEADLKQFKTKDVLMLHMPHREGQPQSAQESSLLDSIQTKLMSLAVEEEEEEEDKKDKKDTKKEIKEEGAVTQPKQHTRQDSNGTVRAPRAATATTHDNEIESLKRDKRGSHPEQQRPTLSHSSSSSVSSTQSSGTHLPMERRRASISAPGLPPRDDVMSMGKRVIGEIGSQFYGLVADIRSATFGDDLTYQNPSLNYGGNNTHTGGQAMHARRVSGAQLRGEASSSPSSRRRSGRDVVDSYSYI
ncbi:hypothetical protein CJU89_0066 [Yarrowia sp. B02]|nr:hypothetical protein CJU89_0066 [Yarrowia sp. B02]